MTPLLYIRKPCVEVKKDGSEAKMFMNCGTSKLGKVGCL